MTATAIDSEIVLIGAGFSGIGMAAELTKRGFDNFMLVETGEDFGGTWYWNRYPGLAVDIPSFSYQYSFAQSDSWSRSYAPGAELQQYATRCAEELGLRERTRFGTKITSAVFDERNHLWRLRTEAGDEIVCRYLVDASGVLTVPKDPDIPGVSDFTGESVHTARWDDSIELAGKRVAVIGTGASAVQLIPEIAPEVEHLTVFQRTPIWCMPKYDFEMPERLAWALRHVPGTGRAMRLLSQTFVELTFPVAANFHDPLNLSGRFEQMARDYLAEQVHDRETREKLTPDYAIGCKRPGFHNAYLATYNRENVTLETDPIAAITPTGVRTESGTEYEVDVLILATGFKTFDPGNLPKYPVAGRGGADLERFWRENRYQAYEGVSVPGFPNYFLVFGPYGYNGASYFNLVETQSRHIVRALTYARDQEASSIEVTPEANGRYFDEMMRRRKRQIFWQPSCANANSYYFDEHGDVPLRPVATIETMWRARSFPLADYRLGWAPAEATVNAGAGQGLVAEEAVG